jgi:hypothetical protein
MRHATIRFRTHEPDYSDLPNVKHKWDGSVYGDVEEELPYKAPPPLGKLVIFTHYVDANLYHNVLTGRSVTGVLHFLNGTPIDWFSKKQATVESATYGSEFVAARTCIDDRISTGIGFPGVTAILSHELVVWTDHQDSRCAAHYWLVLW